MFQVWVTQGIVDVGATSKQPLGLRQDNVQSTKISPGVLKKSSTGRLKHRLNVRIQISQQTSPFSASSFVVFLVCMASILSPCIALSVSTMQSETWTLTSLRSLGKEVSWQQWPQVWRTLASSE